MSDNWIKYEIVPRDDNCVCMFLRKDWGFIRVGKDKLLESVDENTKYLIFDDKKTANQYLNDNFANPYNYVVKEHYVCTTKYYNKLKGCETNDKKVCTVESRKKRKVLRKKNRKSTGV